MTTNTNAFNAGVDGLLSGINASLTDLLKAHMDAHHTHGQAWPDDAVFAAVSRCSTWPCGWSDSSHVDFFGSQELLDKWIADQLKWASLEDNHVAWIVYEWDLGPNRREDLDRNAYRV